MDEDLRGRLGVLLAMQSGVVRSAQLHDLGVAPGTIRRMLRRRELTRVHTGVFVDHTGRLSWDQRSWVAVFACWPAALYGESARRSAGQRRREAPDDGDPVHVLVDAARRLTPPSGVVVHRTRHFATTMDSSTLPPRQRTEEWVLSIAEDAPTERDAIAVITDAVGSRRVRPALLRRALAGRPRHRRRALVAAVIEDAESGTHSVLEHAYLVRVERAHGLPAGRRQAEGAAAGRRVVRDVAYDEFDCYVELDGRLGHTSHGERDRDLDRDAVAAAAGRRTVRLGWSQVFDRPCTTAEQVGRVLAAGGWTGVPRRCPRCP